MSDHRTRIDAMQALIAGSSLRTNATFNVIKQEFEAVCVARRIPLKARRRLLQVPLHPCA
jgi:hypothetical protein